MTERQKPLFKRGDIVHRGPQGTVPYEVIGVVDTSSSPRYDLKSLGALSEGRVFIGVPERKLR